MSTRSRSGSTAGSWPTPRLTALTTRGDSERADAADSERAAGARADSAATAGLKVTSSLTPAMMMGDFLPAATSRSYRLLPLTILRGGKKEAADCGSACDGEAIGQKRTGMNVRLGESADDFDLSARLC